jgi:hypothetical protein
MEIETIKIMDLLKNTQKQKKAFSPHLKYQPNPLEVSSISIITLVNLKNINKSKRNRIRRLIFNLR